MRECDGFRVNKSERERRNEGKGDLRWRLGKDIPWVDS